MELDKLSVLLKEQKYKNSQVNFRKMGAACPTDIEVY